MAYKNILVGIDGSKRAERAFETAVDLAKVFSAKLYLVWVVNRDRGMDSSFGVNEDFYQDFAKRTKKQLQIYLKKAQDKGADASATVIIGSIKTVLAYDFPDQHDIDLIVLGSTGINAVEKMLQGVAYRLCRSSCQGRCAGSQVDRFFIDTSLRRKFP